MSDDKSIVEATEEAELDLPDQTLSDDGILEADSMTAMIKVSHKIAEYDKALSAIINFILKRTYAGDWVSHSKHSDPAHLRTASLSGSGCERVAVALGISEKNWKEHPMEWSEDRKHYGFKFEADFTLGGRTVHGFGEASTRNKFFSFANGSYKELSEIREDHIRKAAMRECQKDGIRRLLGLRKIPLLKLRELGFNIDLVHYVNFKDSKEAISGMLGNKSPATVLPAPEKSTEKTKKEVFESTFTPALVEHKTTKEGAPYSVFRDAMKNELWVFGKPESENVAPIVAAINNAQVRVEHETTEKNGRIFRTVTKVLEVIPL